MGRGDRRTKRGKIFRGSYGKTRQKKVKKTTVKRVAPVETLEPQAEPKESETTME